MEKCWNNAKRAVESNYPSECKMNFVICEKHGKFLNKKALHLEYKSNPMTDSAPCFL